TYLPEAAPELGDGVFVTTDFGEIVDGQVYLRGRASDLINVAGRKVAPEIIENILRTHPQVRDCLVFGVPRSDQDRSERIVACVEANTHPDKENLQTFLLKHLSPWQMPREWHFVTLERNGRGKLSRAQWRERFLESRSKEAF